MIFFINIEIYLKRKLVLIFVFFSIVDSECICIYWFLCFILQKLDKVVQILGFEDSYGFFFLFWLVMYMFGGEGLDFFLVRKYGNVVIYLYVFYYLYNLLMLESFNEENSVNRYRLIDKIILKIDFLMLLLIFLV